MRFYMITCSLTSILSPYWDLGWQNHLIWNMQLRFLQCQFHAVGIWEYKKQNYLVMLSQVRRVPHCLEVSGYLRDPTPEFPISSFSWYFPLIRKYNSNVIFAIVGDMKGYHHVIHSLSPFSDFCSLWDVIGVRRLSEIAHISILANPCWNMCASITTSYKSELCGSRFANLHRGVWQAPGFPLTEERYLQLCQGI